MAGSQTEIEYRVKEKITVKEKLSYGIGALADSLIWSSVGAFGTYYYTNSAKLAAEAVGTMFLISRIFDGISDVLMGILIDKTHTKHGKARPWLLWMAIPYALAAVLLFSVPQSFGPRAKMIYAYITYNLVSTIAYTAIIQPYATLGTLITDNQRDRTHLSIARMGIAMFGSILLNFLVLPMVNGFGGDPSAWTKTFAVLGLVAAIIFFITFKNTKERLGSVVEDPADKDAIKAKSVPTGKAIKGLLTNKYWWNRIVFGLTITMCTATTGVNVYYAKYWLNNENIVGILSIANVIPMLISLILVTRMSEKIGPRNTVQIGVSFILLGLIIQLIAPTNLVLVIFGYAIRGFGTGIGTTLLLVMLGDAIDYGEWKNGFRTEGLIFSASNIGTKIGSGLGAALLGWFLGWGGFNPDLAVQSESALRSILIVFTVVPLISCIIAFIMNLLYDLDKKKAAILADLKQRNTNN